MAPGQYLLEKIIDNSEALKAISKYEIINFNECDEDFIPYLSGIKQIKTFDIINKMYTIIDKYLFDMNKFKYDIKYITPDAFKYISQDKLMEILNIKFIPLELTIFETYLLKMNESDLTYYLLCTDPNKFVELCKQNGGKLTINFDINELNSESTNYIFPRLLEKSNIYWELNTYFDKNKLISKIMINDIIISSYEKNFGYQSNTILDESDEIVFHKYRQNIMFTIFIDKKKLVLNNGVKFNIKYEINKIIFFDNIS